MTVSLLWKLFWNILQDLYYFRSSVIIILTPVLLLPLVVVVNSNESIALYVILITVVYWVTDCLPLAITSLIPLILFPLFGILPAKKDATLLFVSGFLIAIAIESSQLPRRLALRALLIVGSDPKWILMAIMSTTGFLSMWLCNMATTAIMLPIVEAILIELIKDKRSRLQNTNLDEIIIPCNQLMIPDSCTKESYELDQDLMSDEELNLCKMFFLSICYSSNIGGIATLTGTPTNIVALGMIERIYGVNTGINYASWMLFALPLSVLNLGFVWILLLLFFHGFRKTFARSEPESGGKKIMEVIRSHYNNLGPWNFHQILTSILFALLALLWVFRDPKFIPGWGEYFKKGYVSDTSVAALIAFLLFILPSNWPDFLCTRNLNNLSSPPKIQSALLNWPTVHKKFPWGLIFLIGGGFALASAAEQSGLSKIIGHTLSMLSYLSATSVCAIVAVVAAFTTEVATNFVVVSILIPVLSSVIKIGFFINWISIGLTLLAVNTWGKTMFNLGTFPSWAVQKNDILVMNNFSSIVNN